MKRLDRHASLALTVRVLVLVLALAAPLTPVEAQELRPVSLASAPSAFVSSPNVSSPNVSSPNVSSPGAPSPAVLAPAMLQADPHTLRSDGASTPSRAPGRNCPPVRRAAVATLTAIGVLVLPTAVIAGRMADDDWRAARWATYAGSAYSVGMTAYLMSGRPCTSTDGLGYMWAPFAAVAGAFLGTR